MTGMWESRRIQRRAGASANREYERLRREWIARNRKLFLGLTILVSLIIGVSLLMSIPHVGAWLDGVCAGMAMGFLVIARNSPPSWIEKWQVGALGEQRTAKALQPLLQSGWVVINDLKRVRSNRVRYNLDHVIVGPSGVFVLDTKNGAGAAEASGDRLRMTHPDGRLSYDNDGLARHARAQGMELNQLLRQRCGLHSWVTAIVVLWADFPSKVVAGDRMSYVHGSHLVEWLTTQPARLNAHQVQEIAGALQPGHRRTQQPANSTLRG
jgi:hypothetical protein